MKSSRVIIVGGGMVGLTTALALCRNGFEVKLFDKGPQPTKLITANNELRVSALNPSVIAWLDDLGVWSSLASFGTYFSGMHVFEQAHKSQISFSGQKGGCGYLGAIIPNVRLQEAVYKKLQNESNFKAYFNLEIKSIINNERKSIIYMSDDSQYEADIVLGADGGESTVRKLSGIEVDKRPYPHQAIVANLDLGQGYHHQNIAWQRFLPTGPLAFLPLLKDNQVSMVWSLSNNHFDLLNQANDDMFNYELQQVMVDYFPKVELTSRRFSFPLWYRHAKQYIAPGVALLGDACHTMHPLAGQGANLGFSDAKVLIDVLLKARDKYRPLGCQLMLKNYERARRPEIQKMLLAMDFFYKTFGSNKSMIWFFRQLGMNFVDKQEFIKRVFMQPALG